MVTDQPANPTPAVTFSGPMFAMIPEGLLLDTAVPPVAVRVWGILARHGMDAASCWPSQRRIADLAGVSIPTVGRAIKTLEERRWVRVVQRFDSEGAQTSNGYELGMTRFPSGGDDDPPAPDRRPTLTVVPDPATFTSDNPPPITDDRPPLSPVIDERKPFNEKTPLPPKSPSNTKVDAEVGNRKKTTRPTDNDLIAHALTSANPTADEVAKIAADIRHRREIRNLQAFAASPAGRSSLLATLDQMRADRRPDPALGMSPPAEPLLGLTEGFDRPEVVKSGIAAARARLAARLQANLVAVVAEDDSQVGIAW